MGGCSWPKLSPNNYQDIGNSSITINTPIVSKFIRGRKERAPDRGPVRSKRNRSISGQQTKSAIDGGPGSPVNQYVPKSQQGLSPGVYIALGVLAQLCAPDKSWRSFGPWLQKTVVAEHWALPAHLLDAQNFWDHWDLLCPEATMPRTTDDAPILDTDTVFQVEEAVWETVQDASDGGTSGRQVPGYGMC